MVRRSGNYKNLDELWKLYHNANGDGEYYKNKLLEACLPQLKIIAKKIARTTPPNIEFEDLIQEGFFGAIKAIKKFNPNKARFITYLNEKVRSRIHDYIREQDWTPRLIRRRIKQVEEAKDRLRDKLSEGFAQEQLLNELSKDKYLINPASLKESMKAKTKGKEKAELILNDTKNLKQFYLFPLNNFNREIGKDSDEREGIGDYRYQNPQNITGKKDFKDFLYKGLTRREILILNLYYFTFYKQDKGGRLGMPYPEIAEILEVVQSRVSQLHSQLLLRLKSKLTRKGLTLETSLNNL